MTTVNFIAKQQQRLIEQMAELRADRRQDRQRFESMGRALFGLPDQVALRLSVMFKPPTED